VSVDRLHEAPRTAQKLDDFLPRSPPTGPSVRKASTGWEVVDFPDTS
jgi:hypothetical protein